MNWLKAVIVGLLVFGLNQNLLFCFVDFQQKEVAASCTCDPATCMCPPSSGCHHHHKESKSMEKNWLKKKQITACRPNPADQGVISTSYGFEVPILTLHVDDFDPDLSFTDIDRMSAFLSTQYYLTPPDKPPQISFI